MIKRTEALQPFCSAASSSNLLNGINPEFAASFCWDRATYQQPNFPDKCEEGWTLIGVLCFANAQPGYSCNNINVTIPNINN